MHIRALAVAALPMLLMPGHAQAAERTTSIGISVSVEAACSFSAKALAAVPPRNPDGGGGRAGYVDVACTQGSQHSLVISDMVSVARVGLAARPGEPHLPFGQPLGDGIDLYPLRTITAYF